MCATVTIGNPDFCRVFPQETVLIIGKHECSRVADFKTGASLSACWMRVVWRDKREGLGWMDFPMPPRPARKNDAKTVREWAKV